MNTIFEPNPDARELEFLEQQLMAFNCSKIDGYAYEDFMIKSIDDSGAITAGLHGQIGGRWLYIAGLWVAEAHRGRGMGKKLLESAEEVAVEKGCAGAYLYTYSFQSPGFYKRSGYRIFGTLEGFCGDHAKHFMKKHLVQGSPE